MLSPEILALLILLLLIFIFTLYFYIRVRRFQRRMIGHIDDILERLTASENKINALIKRQETIQAEEAPVVQESKPLQAEAPKTKTLDMVVQEYNQTLTDRDKLKKWINEYNAQRVSVKLDAFHQEMGQDSEPVIESDPSGQFVLFNFDEQVWLAPTRAIPYDQYTRFLFKKTFEVDSASEQGDLRITRLIKPAHCKKNGTKWSIQTQGHIKVG